MSRVAWTGTLRLADGMVVSETWAKLPRYWKDRLSGKLPYGTSLFGCEYTLARS